MHINLGSMAFTVITLMVGYSLITQLREKPRRNTMFCILVLAGFITWGGLNVRREGWPERVVQLPDQFIFINGIVREPDVVNGVTGAIWVVIRVEEDPTQPRTLQVPYTPGLASDVKKLSETARIKGMEIPVRVRGASTPKEELKTPKVEV
jgi:hypothetical protein